VETASVNYYCTVALPRLASCQPVNCQKIGQMYVCVQALSGGGGPFLSFLGNDIVGSRKESKQSITSLKDIELGQLKILTFCYNTGLITTGNKNQLENRI